MSILNRLAGLFVSQKTASPRSVRDEHGAYYYVRCGRCGEIIQVRVDRRWDFQQEFESGREDPSGYTVSKEVMGQRCFQMIRATIRFNAQRREIEREIHGGQFVTVEEFEAARAGGRN